MRNFLFIFLTMLICSCQKENDGNLSEPFLEISDTNMNFEQSGGEYLLEISSSEDYTYNLSEALNDWCHVEKDADGNMRISVSENPEKNVRSGELQIVTTFKKETVTISQLGWGKAILLSKSSVFIDEIGGDFSIDVTANVECEINIANCDWVSLVPRVSSRGQHEPVTKGYNFSVKANKETKRSVTVEVRDNDPLSEIEAVPLLVTQKGLDKYSPDGTDMLSDEKIIPESVTGDGGSTSPFENMIDGDINNFWQTQYTPSTKFPQYIEFSFKEKVDMDYMIYYPSSNNVNSWFKDVKIEVFSGVNSSRSESYHTVYEGTIPYTSQATRIDFANSQADVKKVRVTVNSSYGKTLRCAEMEFYKKDPSGFNYETLFADKTCSELKPGVSEQDILDCSHSFYKKIAWYLYNNKYPREFRIAEFKPYPHPNVQRAQNKTKAYSLMDNATGIFINKGERIVVLADLKGKESVKIKVLNLDTPGDDGYLKAIDYTLYNGFNSVEMREQGLIYVLYHPEDYATASPIKLHFATGYVNGYYDSQKKEHEGKWNELLNNTVCKYFDVLGKYAHLTFPVETFRNVTRDGKALIDLYDELVYREQEQLGLVKYGNMFKNRMYFNVMYKGTMYSTEYRTAYYVGTLQRIASEDLFKANCWGPAHEVAHSNQTRPGLRWLGMTEVTNNIQTLHIQTSVFGQTSRLETDDKYSKAWNDMLASHGAFSAVGEIFCKLVPFWQLELYFGKVKGFTPMLQKDHGGFYPDVYEHIRKNSNLPTPGKQQLEFVYISSLCAKANLLDFFEKWGFLTPIDIEITDYQKGRLTITEKDIEEIKERVNKLGFEKPDVALEYITDYNLELYKEKRPIEVGRVSKDGNTFTFSNWKNVVAFEVYDNNGVLKYVKDGFTKVSFNIEFTLPFDWQSGYEIKAVSSSGVRTDVEI